MAGPSANPGRGRFGREAVPAGGEGVAVLPARMLASYLARRRPVISAAEAREVAELRAREVRRAEANARELIAEGQVRELSEKEWEQMADEQARKYLGISAAEFARRLKTGEMDVDEDPNGMRVAMLLGPLAK